MVKKQYPEPFQLRTFWIKFKDDNDPGISIKVLDPESLKEYRWNYYIENDSDEKKVGHSYRSSINTNFFPCRSIGEIFVFGIFQVVNNLLKCVVVKTTHQDLCSKCDLWTLFSLLVLY